MSTRKPKWQGKKIKIGAREGVIIYAGGQKLLVQFPDKSRLWVTRPVSRPGDEFEITD